MGQHVDGGVAMMGVARLQELLADRTLGIVAHATGIHRNTLAAIKSGRAVSASPRVRRALTDYLMAVCHVEG